MKYPHLRPDRLAACLADAAESPMAAPDVEIPDWYQVRWHFLPEGYLSRRSVAAYDALIPRLYNLLQPGRLDSAVVNELRRERTGSLLHIGCGPGRLLRRAAGALPSARMLGVDLSPFMLERARDRLRSAPDRTEFHHADATRLPFAKGTVDGAVMLHFLGHIPAATGHESLTEAARVLRPGGALVTVDHRWHAIVPVPASLRLERRRLLLAGSQVLRVYRRTGGDASTVADWRHSDPGKQERL